MIFLILNKLNKIKKFPFYFLMPVPYAIGTASEQILVAANYARIKKKKLKIIYLSFFSKILQYRICNKALFTELTINKFGCRLNILIRIIIYPFLEIEYLILRILIILNNFTFKFQVDSIYKFSPIGGSDMYNTKKITNKNFWKKKLKDIPKLNYKKNLIDLIKKKKNICKKELQSMKTERTNKIICLHVRDSHYKNDHKRKNYRNSDINRYIKTIKFLINQGYLVVRMGSVKSKKFKFTHKYFINYPDTTLIKKSAAMELYLIQKAKYFIGTQSGIYDTAIMFGKPTLLTNMIHLTTFPLKKEDRGLFRSIFDKKTKNKILINKYINYSWSYHDPNSEIHNIKFVENTEDEIYKATVEFLKLKTNKITYLQKKLNFKIKKSISKMFSYKNYNKIKSEQTNILRKIRIRKTCEGSLSNFNLINI